MQHLQASLFAPLCADGGPWVHFCDWLWDGNIGASHFRNQQFFDIIVVFWVPKPYFTLGCSFKLLFGSLLLRFSTCPEWQSGPAKVADFFAGCLSVFAWTSHDNVQTPFPVNVALGIIWNRFTWIKIITHITVVFSFFGLSLSSFLSSPRPPATKLTVSLSNLSLWNFSFPFPIHLPLLSHCLYQTESPHLYTYLPYPALGRCESLLTFVWQVRRFVLIYLPTVPLYTYLSIHLSIRSCIHRWI